MKASAATGANIRLNGRGRLASTASGRRGGAAGAVFTVEALTNAFKHAFHAGKPWRGNPRPSLHECDGDKLCLSVEDDGRGFAEEELEASIGTQLIRTFGQQLHGKAGIHSQKDNGTVAEIVCSPTRKRKRRARNAARRPLNRSGVTPGAPARPRPG